MTRQLKVGIPERMTGPYAPVPPRILAAVERIGCETVVIRRADGIVNTPQFDALLLTGGPTPHPTLYSSSAEAATSARTDHDPERDTRELEILQRCLAADLPVLGLCRGMQILAIHFGGRLSRLRDAQLHTGPPTANVRRPVIHSVTLDEASGLASLIGVATLDHCSSQHQFTVEIGGSHTKAIGWAADGTIEAIEVVSGRALGVMWHPEDTAHDDALQASIFQFLVRGATRP